MDYPANRKILLFSSISAVVFLAFFTTNLLPLQTVQFTVNFPGFIHKSIIIVYVNFPCTVVRYSKCTKKHWLLQLCVYSHRVYIVTLTYCQATAFHSLCFHSLLWMQKLPKTLNCNTIMITEDGKLNNNSGVFWIQENQRNVWAFVKTNNAIIWPPAIELHKSQNFYSVLTLIQNISSAT